MNFALSLDWHNIKPLFDKFKCFDFVKVKKHNGKLDFDEFSSHITEFTIIAFCVFNFILAGFCAKK